MIGSYLGLAILSAAALAFEIALTRLFSVTQWYHFAFLAVSVALLGYGASGTALSLAPAWSRPPTERRASILAILFSASIVGAYLCLNYLPFDSYRIAWERIQILYLALYYLALTVPFFCAGLVTGLMLAAHPGRASRLYAANLLGSAAGGLVPVLVLPHTGEGIVLVLAALGLLAALTFHLQRPWNPSRLAGSVVLLVVCGSLVCLAWSPPLLFQLRLSPYKGLSQVLRYPDAEIIWQRWNAFSRVDRVASSAIRSAPGLSLSYPAELPAQDGLFVDGDDLSPILENATALDLERLRGFTDYLPVALPYQMRPGSQVLMLEPRGGLDLAVALSQDADRVVVVVGNPLLVEASSGPYTDPRATIVVEEGRSYASRTTQTFDLIHLALGDSYRPVTSGAYSLSERYDLTVEAFTSYMARLKPEGLLIVERWLQYPPSETLRAGAVALKALKQLGVENPQDRMAVLRGWQVGLLLVKNGDWMPTELDQIRAFCQEQELDLVLLPGLDESEANRFNLFDEPVYYRAFAELLEDPQSLYASHPYDVRPPTDDRPFFFHFFRWGQATTVLGQLGKLWLPWGGSGYLVIVALLGIATVISLLLIVAPLVVAKGKVNAPARLRWQVVAYFGLLGLGFLLVEIPLMQRFILFLDQPIYAFTTVAAALLFFSGLGSLAAPHLSFRHTLPILVVAILSAPWTYPLLFDTLLGASLWVRLAVTAISLAPLGLLMGIPFPAGLAWLENRAPGLIPWVWAVNGCGSVLASILAAMIALSAGFSWVLVTAAVAYAGAWLVMR